MKEVPLEVIKANQAAAAAFNSGVIATAYDKNLPNEAWYEFKIVNLECDNDSEIMEAMELNWQGWETHSYVYDNPNFIISMRRKKWL